ncbi:lysine--tRNA ligase [Rothia sp. P3C3.S176]|uniref:lysine--tRNA ligase n=1 Tax=Rothia sp. P3C3.S176 TaxID=2962204 RepID=UPI0020C8BF33|nr:lysine--tRNA ligase [Rothia sp. P3C3.S176]
MSTEHTAAPAIADMSEQMQIRLEKRAKLIESGREAYPVGLLDSEGNRVEPNHIEDLRAEYDPKLAAEELKAGDETDRVVHVGGRVVFVRNTGKLCFVTLQGGTEGKRIQAMLSLAEVGEESLSEWKSLVDLGDHVFVTGRVIVSRRGELSIMVTDWKMASKAVRPMPVLHKDLNEETRVRQRYLDLMVREEARELVKKRALITRTVRRVLEDHGYIEVETPVLQLVHGGATARPFRTHLNAFDQPMTMRIATELPLKRAVVGGIDRVYEIGRVFRNEGVDSTHSPEFTTLECYETYADQFVMAERMKEIIQSCAKAVGTERIETENGTIDLFGEWKWVGVYPGLSEVVGVEITPETDASVLREIAEKHEVDIDPKWDAEKLVTELFGEIVEPTLVNPTFVYDYPPSAQPLARPHRSGEPLIEAWDLIIGGMERGTAFSELIDPVIQRERLTAQSLLAAAGDDEAMELDEDFLRALEHGAPPMGGLGLGIDRLIMLLAGDQDPERPGTVVRQPGIRETILFPLMKPEA